MRYIVYFSPKMKIIYASIIVLFTQTILADGFNLQEVVPGIYIHTGMHVGLDSPHADDIANIGFIVGEECIAVIDTGGSFSIATQLKKAIKQISALPICYVINTHVHFDHILGNKIFQDKTTQFIGHHNLANEVIANQDFFLQEFPHALGEKPNKTAIIAPTILVDKTLEVDLGNRKLSLVAHPAAHSYSDLSIYDHKTNTLWLGDLLFTERLPVLDGSLKGWLNILEELSKKDLKLVIPGHGPIAKKWPTNLQPQLDYLQKLLTDTRQIIAEDVFISEAAGRVAKEEKKRWKLHEQSHGRNVSKAFSELEWE